MEKLSIIIPAYNEKATLLAVIRLVRGSNIGNIKKEIILVDDCSTDGTRDIISAIPATDEEGNEYKKIFHDANKGKGAALRSGFLAVTGEYVIIQDADMEYEPGDYHALLKPVLAGEADIVFGSRTLQKNNIPFNAVYFYGGLLVAKLFNLFFRRSFSDITTCYKLFPRRCIPALLKSHRNDFVFDAIDMTYALARAGVIKEIPIHYAARTRRAGKKLNWKHGVYCVIAMIALRRREGGRYVSLSRKQDLYAGMSIFLFTLVAGAGLYIFRRIPEEFILSGVALPEAFFEEASLPVFYASVVFSWVELFERTGILAPLIACLTLFSFMRMPFSFFGRLGKGAALVVAGQFFMFGFLLRMTYSGGSLLVAGALFILLFFCIAGVRLGKARASAHTV
ncbi:MAG: glycosyltransferase family 2 protein [bacterium]|nr:glycosyltransferase family 2 protein [bacterium]